MGLFFYTKIGSIRSIGDLPTTNIIEPFTAARINDSAWGDGKLVLEDSVATSLKQQAEDLIQAIQ